jgi:hypothetical protein
LFKTFHQVDGKLLNDHSFDSEYENTVSFEDQFFIQTTTFKWNPV